MTKLSINRTISKAKFFAKNGNIEEAKNLYRLILNTFPKNKRANEGLISLSKKSQNATTKSPDQKLISQLLGLYNQGEFASAIDRANVIIEKYPNEFVVWNILGASYRGLNLIIEASAAFKKVTVLNPSYADGFNNFGSSLYDQENIVEAILCYKKAISLKPDFVEAYYNMGTAYKAQGKLQEAMDAYAQALLLKPDYADVYNNMGNVLKEQGKLDEAIQAYTKVQQLKPEYAESYSNMGIALQYLGKLEEAIESFKKSISLNPESAEAFNNISNVFKEQGEFEKAIKTYEKALFLKPDYADAIWNRSLAFLSMEDFNRGWSQYEARWKQSNNTSIPLQSSKPRWKPNKSGRVLIWPEQGLGDLIMFSSVIPEIYKQVKKLIVQIDDRLIPLFKRSFPSDIIYFGLTERITEEQYDFHIPIGSLPLYFRKDLQSFKLNNGPYLKADTYKTNNLRSKLLSDGTKNLIGISWHSTNQLKGAQNRVISLSKLASISGSPKTKLISLQYGDVEKDIVDLFSDFNIKIHQVPEINNKNDIDGLASLISACDRIISIDNSTIHLAGALGKKSKLLLPYACDWRWGRNSNKSYWYNSVELYRQKEIGNWDEVISKL